MNDIITKIHRFNSDSEDWIDYDLGAEAANVYVRDGLGKRATAQSLLLDKTAPIKYRYGQSIYDANNKVIASLTWDNIQRWLNEGRITDFLKPGDCIEITLNGAEKGISSPPTWHFYVIGINTHNGQNRNGNDHFLNHIDFCGGSLAELTFIRDSYISDQYGTYGLKDSDWTQDDNKSFYSLPSNNGGPYDSNSSNLVYHTSYLEYPMTGHFFFDNIHQRRDASPSPGDADYTDIYNHRSLQESLKFLLGNGWIATKDLHLDGRPFPIFSVIETLIKETNGTPNAMAEKMPSTFNIPSFVDDYYTHSRDLNNYSQEEKEILLNFYFQCLASWYDYINSPTIEQNYSNENLWVTRYRRLALMANAFFGTDFLNSDDPSDAIFTSHMALEILRFSSEVIQDDFLSSFDSPWTSEHANYALRNGTGLDSMPNNNKIYDEIIRKCTKTTIEEIPSLNEIFEENSVNINEKLNIDYIIVNQNIDTVKLFDFLNNLIKILIPIVNSTENKILPSNSCEWIKVLDMLYDLAKNAKKWNGMPYLQHSVEDFLVNPVPYKQKLWSLTEEELFGECTYSQQNLAQGQIFQYPIFNDMRFRKAICEDLKGFSVESVQYGYSKNNDVSECVLGTITPVDGSNTKVVGMYINTLEPIPCDIVDRYENPNDARVDTPICFRMEEASDVAPIGPMQ